MGHLRGGVPHGTGQLWVSVGPRRPERLAYEGDWNMGKQTGFGTLYFPRSVSGFSFVISFPQRQARSLSFLGLGALLFTILLICFLLCKHQPYEQSRCCELRRSGTGLKRRIDTLD